MVSKLDELATEVGRQVRSILPDGYIVAFVVLEVGDGDDFPIIVGSVPTLESGAEGLSTLLEESAELLKEKGAEVRRISLDTN